MIYIGSRYENAEVQYILDGRTMTTRPTVSRAAVVLPPPRVIYRWSDGDRPDLLGKRFTDKASNWWMVMDRNSDIIDPLGFSPGNRMVVG